MDQATHNKIVSFIWRILGILREAEQGKPLPELLRQYGIAAGTYPHGEHR